MSTPLWNSKTDYVFISYSTKDQKKVDALKQTLDQQKIVYWMAPFDIPVGSQYASVINQALENCACVLLLLSSNSQESKWVGKEIERAISNSKPIFPLQIENLALNDSFKFYIGDTQIIRVHDFKETSPELEKVVASISALLGSKSTTQQLTTRIHFKAHFSSHNKSSLFFHSPDSTSTQNPAKYLVTNEWWNNFAQILKEIISVVFGTTSDLVTVKALNYLGEFSCAPIDGHSHYDDPFRLDFQIRFLTNRNFDEFHTVNFDFDENFSMSLFDKNGSYVFREHPTEELSFYGIDEPLLTQLSKQLITFLSDDKDVIIASSFTKRVYSDGSGHFELNVLNL